MAALLQGERDYRTGEKGDPALGRVAVVPGGIA